MAFGQSPEGREGANKLCGYLERNFLGKENNNTKALGKENNNAKALGPETV